MENDKIWGTDVEIYVLVTALDTPIAVYYKAQNIPGFSSICKQF